MQQTLSTSDRSTSHLYPESDFPGINGSFLVFAALSLAILYPIQLYSFLLFHVLAEIFSVIVAFGIFMFTWNTRDKIRNNTLIVLGAAFLVIGMLDLFHTFSYKGMGVFKSYGADTATQLWIAARYVQSITLAAAPLFATRKFSMNRALAGYGFLFLLLIITIFFWRVFPVCYVEGVGLTPFKKISEYVISLILLISLATLRRQRSHFDWVVYRLLQMSIVITIGSELMFTIYRSVFGIPNLAGHMLKLGAFWLIYKAIVEIGLQRPYSLLFRELAQQEKRYRDLVDRLPIAIFEIDPDFRVRYMNPAGLRMTGYHEQDLRNGIHLNMLLDSRLQEKAQRRLDGLRQGYPIGSTNYQIQRKDGEMVDVIVNSAPIYQNGELQTIQTSMTDVTELNRLQRNFQQTRKMEAIAVLAGGMAHEINNTLMGVIGGIDLVRLKMVKGMVNDDDFSPVLKGCKRIAKLIEHLVAYSRGGRYRSEPIDMAAFIAKAMTKFKKQLRPDIQLDWAAAENLPLIEADPLQLEMVVSGIVNNAAEAIDAAGYIKIDLQERLIDFREAGRNPGMQPGRYIRFRVRDSGKGMDEEMLQHIFEPFYTSKFTGRGLGMAAVYGIVKNHGGWIGVESEPGRGTTVCIFFPVSASVSLA